MLTLREARKSRRVTQTEMADIINVSRQTYASWEKKPQLVSVKNAQLICGYLDYSIDDIFFAEDVS